MGTSDAPETAANRDIANAAGCIRLYRCQQLIGSCINPLNATVTLIDDQNGPLACPQESALVSG